MSKPPFGAAKTYDSDGGPVHVALVATYPTQREAEAELTVGLMDAPTYRGIWQLPEPYGAVVHVFTDAEPERLEAAGWTRNRGASVTTYRTGDDPRTLYRGNDLIGVCFDPADTALIVDAMERGTPDVDYLRGAAEALALVASVIADYAEANHSDAIPLQTFRLILERAAAELGIDGEAPSGPASSPVSAQQPPVGGSGRAEGAETLSGPLTDDRRCRQCGEPVTDFEGEPHTELDLGRGYLETLSVAYLLKPCGHVFIQDVRGDSAHDTGR